MPLSREEAIATLTAGQDELDLLLEQLNETELGQPATIGGGSWAAKDVMGHIGFWEELALQTVDAFRAGHPPHFASQSTEELNASNQAAQAQTSPTELRARSASAHEAVLAALHNLSDTEWHAALPWPSTEHPTLSHMLGSVLGAPDKPFGHAYAHLQDLKKFVQKRH